jgi:hypothetical protein
MVEAVEPTSVLRGPFGAPQDEGVDGGMSCGDMGAAGRVVLLASNAPELCMVYMLILLVVFRVSKFLIIETAPKIRKGSNARIATDPSNGSRG